MPGTVPVCGYIIVYKNKWGHFLKESAPGRSRGHLLSSGLQSLVEEIYRDMMGCEHSAETRNRMCKGLAVEERPRETNNWKIIWVEARGR